jgi:hypothetical protein
MEQRARPILNTRHCLILHAGILRIRHSDTSQQVLRRHANCAISFLLMLSIDAKGYSVGLGKPSAKLCGDGGKVARTLGQRGSDNSLLLADRLDFAAIGCERPA